LDAVKRYLPDTGKIRLLIWIAAITGGLALTAFQITKRIEEPSSAALSPGRDFSDAKPVEVLRILPSDWELWKSYYGEARSVKTMDATSLVREIVEAVHVNVGDKVSAGQLLLTLRHEDQAAGERAGAAALSEAKLTYDRLSALCREGGVSQAEVDKAYAVLKSEEAKSQNYRSALRQTQVRSKIDGIVTARYAEPGEVAETGQTLLSVEDLSGMDAQLMVSIKDVGRISANTPVVITANGVSSAGRVKRVNPKAEPGSGLCPVIVAIDPEAGVLPGTYLEGSFMIQKETDAVVIPSSAVFNMRDGQFVYTADGDGKRARLTKIVTGSGRDGRILAVSGLEPGDLLITSGNRGLADGALISCDISPEGQN
jgi:RND family efflux transporter MFP subunit